jgi:hypothetical protein
MPHRMALAFCLSLVTLLGAAAPASARDVCVEDGVTSFRFKGVKALKKPGSISPLNGFFTNGSQHAPVSGTAFTRLDGSVAIGVYVHAGGTTPASMDVDFVYDLVGDAALSATGVYRYLDGQVGGYAATWSPIPCKMLPTP